MRAAAALLDTKGRSRRQRSAAYLPSRVTASYDQTIKVHSSETINSELDQIARSVVDCAFIVHKELGPGLLESVYEACFCEELRSRSIPFKSQVAFPIQYKNLRLDGGLRLDLLIKESIIVELKSVRQIEPIFKAQLLSYLRLTGLRLGLLIKFNVALIRDGIFRIAL
jgi:GxxExxY protein